MIQERLTTLRRHMMDQKLDILVVRSTDEYLNEYVPKATSLRAYITNFTGSVGDALITNDAAFLFVDGRYRLQGAEEARDYDVTVTDMNTSIEDALLSKLGALAKDSSRIGIETFAIPSKLYSRFEECAAQCKATLVPTIPSLVAKVREERKEAPAPAKGKIWAVGSHLTGQSVKERIASLATSFQKDGVDGYVCIPLDEIAWLCNLRSDTFPFQATFPSQAIVTQDRVELKVRDDILKDVHYEDTIRASSQDFGSRFQKGCVIGYDPSSTPQSVVDELNNAGIATQECASPWMQLRAQKNCTELAHMSNAFRRADASVAQLQRWLATNIEAGEHITELDVAKRMESIFKETGAWGLSFNVISGSNANGAIIHYGSPDNTRALKEEDYYLLDTGAYYEGAYATDLTRSFVVSRRPGIVIDERYKRMFTLVLKASIAGMSARVPKGTKGEQLDAIVRAPMWRAGFDYTHGTGHGVGVNVHEFPPRISTGSRAEIKPGHVFSIEPGYYEAGAFGIRIENLCMCVVDPDDDTFLRIKPLTFSPLDERLIVDDMLSAHERNFLEWFRAGFEIEDRLAYSLPPLS